jgi:hypothetical protein
MKLDIWNMRKIFAILVAVLTLLPSCKKNQDTPEKPQYSPIGKQWLLTSTTDDYSMIYDYTAEPGYCFRLSSDWKNLPDATYLVSDNSIYPYTCLEAEDCFRMKVEVYGDGTPEARLIEEFYDMTETTASLRSIYHDSSRDITEYYNASVMTKPVKIIRSPLKYLAFQKGFMTCNLRTSSRSRERLLEMGKSKKWQIVNLGAEGSESDYAGKDFSGKIVTVQHSFVQPKAGALTPTQKLDIAARKGAAAVIILFVQDPRYPMTLEQFNTLPADDSSIPFATFGSFDFEEGLYQIRDGN